MSLRDDTMYIGHCDKVDDSYDTVEDNEEPSGLLASALECKSRVLHFGSPRLCKNRALPQENLLDIAGPLLSVATPEAAMRIYSRMPLTEHVPEAVPPVSLTARNILYAPGIRNDFYCNLVAWSASSRVGVGLGNRVYSWGMDETVDIIADDMGAAVTCVGSHSGLWFVGTDSGEVFMVHEAQNIVLDRQKIASGRVLCMEFTGNTLFIGDEGGNVHVVHISDTSFTVQYSNKCTTQQVCGLAVNKEGGLLAVGANDNQCTIYTVGEQLQRKVALPHAAAVKAVAFCPWCSSLIATGGGSKDRKIHFWHVGTGTLLATHETNAQVTSLAWAETQREITATFGFGLPTTPSMAVYSYPQMAVVKILPRTGPLRALCVAMSPDRTSVCLVASDHTVRVYGLWRKGKGLRGWGMGGIIGLVEGNMVSGVVR